MYLSHLHLRNVESQLGAIDTDGIHRGIYFCTDISVLTFKMKLLKPFFFLSLYTGCEIEWPGCEFKNELQNISTWVCENAFRYYKPRAVPSGRKLVHHHVVTTRLGKSPESRSCSWLVSGWPYHFIHTGFLHTQQNQLIEFQFANLQSLQDWFPKITP